MRSYHILSHVVDISRLGINTWSRRTISPALLPPFPYLILMPPPVPMRYTTFPSTPGPMHPPVNQPAAPNLGPEAIAALLAQYQVLSQSQIPLGLPGLPGLPVAPAPAPVTPVIDPNLEVTSSILNQLLARIDTLETEAKNKKRRCNDDDDDDGGNAPKNPSRSSPSTQRGLTRRNCPFAGSLR